MYRVECKQCKASVLTENGATNNLSCGCCDGSGHPEGIAANDHEGASNACSGAGKEPGQQHPGAPCPHPSENGIGCNALTLIPGVSQDVPEGEPCPGGHCWPGVEGCTTCRPCTVYFMGQIAPVPGAIVTAGR